MRCFVVGLSRIAGKINRMMFAREGMELEDRPQRRLRRNRRSIRLTVTNPQSEAVSGLHGNP